MIVYVDLEHDRLRKDPVAGRKSLANQLAYKYRVEEVSGKPCLIVRYPNVNPDLLQKLGAQVVLVSGCVTDFVHFDAADLAGLEAVYRQAKWPILGFCAGHQLMARAYGAEIGAIEDATQSSTAKQVREDGFMSVQQFDSHPLFSDLPLNPVFFQNHYWEVKNVPAGFQNLANSDLCGVQAIAHFNLPLYGVQFHPEEYDAEHGDGRILLENFFRIVGGASKTWGERRDTRRSGDTQRGEKR